MQPPEYTFDKNRLAALESYNILDTPPEEGFEDIVSLASHICETPVALVSFVAGNRQWFKARVGFEACETDLDSSVCAHALVEADILVIPDLTQDERTKHNPLVADEPHIRFYAGAPLRAGNGEVIGSLCVIDGKPRPQGLSELQANGLQNLARQVMTQLDLRRAVQERDEAIAAQATHERHRRVSDEQFQALFDAIEDGFCIVEMKFDGDQPLDYRFVEINPAFAQQTGLTNARGKWMRDLAPGHEQHWFERYGHVAMTGEAIRFEHFAQELGERWFEVHAFRVGEPSRNLVGILFNDKTDRKAAEDLKRSSERAQDILNHELSHRMKNSFAMIQAIATQTLRGVAEREPVEAFTKRLQALSSAHDVLLKQNWQAASLDDAIRNVLETLCHAQSLDISGPPVALGPRATLSVSLLLHELATNALKYGSLSVDGGRVHIAWRLTGRSGAEELVLDWQETGGPAALEPTRKGFGSKLIKMGLSGTGGADMRYLPAGFQAEFTAPLAELQQA